MFSKCVWILIEIYNGLCFIFYYCAMNVVPFNWTNLNPLYPTMFCDKLNWNWPSGSRFFNFVDVFLLFCNYLPLQKGVVLNLYKFEFPLPKDELCQVWLKLAQWFWRGKFLNFVNVFSLFIVIISPLEKGGALPWTNLNPLLPRMHCVKFNKNWPSG